jgi:luciferase family oxidoreductase group 1
MAVPALRLSVLDLAPVPSGVSVGDALRRSIDLARRAEALGFERYWVAEHHSMPGIASSSPAVLIAHLAMATSTMRIGSGGVMLPNHAPLAIAEQFGMLEAIHPGRIDLGLGRAPGTDGLTARALRGTRLHESEDFLERMGELFAFFRSTFPADHPYARIQAVPGAGHLPDVWVLGSSDWGAQVAGGMGLPFAFAHHFGMGGTEQALDLYRSSFRPSDVLDRPHAMIGVQVLAADTEARARWLAGASALGFLRLRQGQPGTMPTPEEAAAHPYTESERTFLDHRLRSAILGTADQVRDGLIDIATRYELDEVMITTSTHAHEDRVRSFELVASSGVVSVAA